MNAIILTALALAQWDIAPEVAAWDVTADVAPVQVAAWSVAPEPAPTRPDVLLDTLPEPLATADAAHTPMSEVVRVLDLLPRPQVGFVDLGCGYDARWCIAAAEKWGCRVTGVEIDPQRAAAARERVRNLGLDHLITIVEGDVGTAEIQGDVAVAYLYPDLLERIKPRLEYFRAFASYLHEPPGLPVVKNGDSWVYTKPQQTAVAQSKAAVWQGRTYTRPVCTSAGCQMCASIRFQLSRR
jgi:hypothetical protein